MKAALFIFFASVVVAFAPPPEQMGAFLAAVRQQSPPAAGGGGSGTVTFEKAWTAASIADSADAVFPITNTASGSDTYLIVSVSLSDGVNRAVTSVTVSGGYTMTMLTNGLPNNSSASGHLYLYGLVNPPTGSNQLTIATGTSTTAAIIMGQMLFSGVNQSSPVGGTMMSYGSSATATITISSAANNLVADAVATGSSCGAAGGTGHTRRWLNNYDTQSGAGNCAGGSTTGAASVTPTYSVTSDYWVMCAASLAHD